uniref:Uncharacterized protein n=1 Tax=Meloidogyne enterolobii TaxID=390850 RepID=A0A6V7XJN7_MELEN|nr:unnamed protein product [Meloidogyne enterolobii]
MEYPYKNDRKISRSFSLLILFTLININLAILFSPINACDLFLLNRGNTLGCGGLCPPSCGLSLLNLASPFQGALPLPPQPPPTILQPQIPAAYTAPRLLPPPFFRAPSLLPPPPILPNVLAPPIVQTAPIVPPPKILQPEVSNLPTQVQLIPLAMCAMPCRKKVMSPAIPRNTCCNGDYCDIDCCSDDCMFMRKF